MQKIFLWFYCLPISEAVALIAGATLVFLLLRIQFRNAPYWKTALCMLFVCWIAVILFGTLGLRTESGNPRCPILTPFYSYYAALSGGNKELYRTNFMNAVLFYPAGLFGCELLPPRRRGGRIILLTCAFALVSIGIEYSQYRFGLGLAEADDVIHNTLGTCLGAIACGGFMKLNKK